MELQMAKSKKPKPSVVDVSTFLPVPRGDPARGTAPHMKALDPVPEGIKDLEAYLDAERDKLLPIAMKEKEWRLKFGTDDQRNEAANDMFRFRRYGQPKEDGVNIRPAIVLINAPSPWAKRVEVVIDGEHKELTDANEKKHT
jgi:hypothetical protein